MIYYPYSEDMATMLSKGNVTLALAADIDFPSGVSRVHTGTGTILINGQVYYGVGTLGEVGSVAEENTTSAATMSMTLSGLDLSLVAETLNERCVDRDVVTYLVALNKDGTVGAINVLFKGFISDTSLLAGKQNAINYNISNIFERWSYGLPVRYTDESQRSVNGGDRIFRYVAQMSERSIYWGSKKDAPAFIYK